MKWRRLRPGELDHEALWLGVSLASAGVAAGWLALGLPRLACFFHSVTGWPCPACGTTRCLAFVFRSEFGAALRINPLCCVFLVGVAIFDLYAATVLVARLPRLRSESATLSPPFRWLVVSALLLNWAWLIARGV